MKQTIAEKYMTARTTSSLKLKPDTTSSPTDILTVAGMVGGKHGLAMQLWALMHSPSRNHLESLAQTLAYRLDGYMLAKKIHAREHALPIAQQVLAWHLWGTCPHCKGRGEGMIEGTPHTNGIPCDHCGGSRKVKLVTAHDEAAKWLCQEIEQLTHTAEFAMGKKIRA